MDRLYLIALIAGQRIALAADRIESVVELGDISPVPQVAAHIAGLSPLRSRVITVIDSRAALGLDRRPIRDGQEAVVAVIDGHSYGLTADRVEDVVTVAGDPLPVTGAIGAGWRAATIGMVEVDGLVVPLLSVEALVAGMAPPAARAA